MKVLFTGLFPIWQCHFIGECNFMEEHQRAGDSVDVLICDSNLKSCDANPGMALPNCLACIETRNSGLDLIDTPPRKLPLISVKGKKAIEGMNIPVFTNNEDLISYAPFGVSTGSDVISSIITALGNPNFYAKNHPELIKRTIEDYMAAYFTALDYINREGYSLVYIFNGRFSTAKAWIRACEKMKIEYCTLERLGMPDRVLKIKGGTVHETKAYASWVKTFWDINHNNADIIKEAVDFFEERPKGVLTGWHSFITDQDQSALPVGWDPEKRNIAIFSSTETEFSGLPESFLGATYSDQKKCYCSIVKAIKEMDENIHFYLRIHPNSKNENEYWWESDELRELTNLTIILPESDVSSYLLMNSCEKTLAFMSTVGIEATYWGNPSILLSNATYKGIGAVYEPTTETDTISLILDESLPPKPRDATLAYGAFIRRGFPKLPHSEALDHCTLTFKGVRPNASQLAIKALWRWENVIKPSRIPNFLKQAWQVIEWHRIRLIHKL